MPVLNLNRDDVRLRPDVILALRNSNIDVQNLYFLDDPGVPKAMDEAPAITIVDHNNPSANQSSLSPRVVGIIDHHADERLFQNVNPRTIVKTGSCATLVSEYALQLRDDDSAERTEGLLCSPACALLLLSAILLDCINMDNSSGKSTPRDVQAAEYLTSLAGLTVRERDDLFRSLLRARSDISQFSALDLLRKDAKIVKVGRDSVIISSVPTRIDDLDSRADSRLADFVKQFAGEREMSAVVIMLGFSHDGVFARDLVVSTGPVGDELAFRLENDEEAKSLQLKPATEKLEGLHCFHQLNTKASRKAVLPVIKSFMSSIQKP